MSIVDIGYLVWVGRDENYWFQSRISAGKARQRYLHRAAIWFPIWLKETVCFEVEKEVVWAMTWFKYLCKELKVESLIQLEINQSIFLCDDSILLA